MLQKKVKKFQLFTWYEKSGMKSFLYTDGYSFSKLFQALSRGTKYVKRAVVAFNCSLNLFRVPSHNESLETEKMLWFIEWQKKEIK